MKKRIFKFLALFLAVSISIFTVGCTEDNTLYFNNDFLGGGAVSDAPMDYTESLTYDVTYTPAFEKVKKADILTQKAVNYNFTGTFEMNFSSSLSIPEEYALEIDGEAQVYCLTSTLTLNAWYDLEGTFAEGYTEVNGGKQYVDTIKSKVYFLPKGHSFAPIVSTVEQDYTSLFASNSKFEVAKTKTSSKTVYKNNSYTTTLTYPDGSQKVSTCDYEFKTAIDNAQFLFALRNLTVNSGTVNIANLPVITPAYDSPQTLSVTNKAENTTSWTIDGVQADYVVKNLLVYRQDAYNRGLSQYLLVTKTTNDTPQLKSQVLQYAYPLLTYGTNNQMGALVYKLVSVK